MTRVGAYLKAVSLFMGLAMCSVGQAASLGDMVRDGVISSIRWERFWFGYSLGAECIGDGKVDVVYKVFVPNFDRNLDDSYYARRRVEVFVAGTNTIYVGTLWRGKVTLQPAIGSKGCVTDEEIKAISDFSGGAGYVRSFKSGFSLLNERFSPNRSSSPLVEGYVGRSLVSFLGEAEVNRRSFSLAYYSLSDPYLIVVDFEGEEILLVDFPSVSEMENGYVGNVYSGGIFMGSDAEASEHQKAVNHCFELLGELSTRLEVRGRNKEN